MEITTNKGAYIVVIVVAANQETHNKINQITQFIAEYSERVENLSPRFILVETKIDLINTNLLFKVLTMTDLHQFNVNLFGHIAVSSMTEENIKAFNALMQKAVQAVIGDPTNQFQLHAPKYLYTASYTDRGITHYVESRINHTETYHKIWSLLEVNAQAILANIKQFLIKGDIDRIGQRYFMIGNGASYNTGDQIVTVPNWVKKMLDIIDGNNKYLKSAKDILVHIYISMSVNTLSSSMIFAPNTPSTLEFHNHYLAKYLEEVVMKYSTHLDEARSKQWVTIKPQPTADLADHDTKTSQVITVPESFSRSDNLTPRGEASTLDELKPPPYDKNNPPIEAIETTPLAPRHYHYYGGFPR